MLWPVGGIIIIFFLMAFECPLCKQSIPADCSELPNFPLMDRMAAAQEAVMLADEEDEDDDDEDDEDDEEDTGAAAKFDYRAARRGGGGFLDDL